MLQKVLDERDDLGCFVVHLTRANGARTGLNNLASIIGTEHIRARTAFGIAQSQVAYMLGFVPQRASLIPSESQRCICFTEAPLKFVPKITQRIDGRQNQFEPYGVAIPRARAREFGANWVWYIHDRSGLPPQWDDQIGSALRRGDFSHDRFRQLEGEDFQEELRRLGRFMLEDSLFRLTPLLEMCFTNHGGAKKEFWWEREWRYVGDLYLRLRGRPSIIICPIDSHDQLKREVAEVFLADPDHIEELGDKAPAVLERLISNLTLIDANWSLDEIKERHPDYTWNRHLNDEQNLGRMAKIPIEELRPWA